MNKKSKQITLVLIVMISVFILFFFPHSFSEFQFRRTLEQISNRNTNYIEPSILGKENALLGEFLRQEGYRGKIVERIYKSANTTSELRTKSVLLHFLVVNSPQKDLLKPLRTVLKSNDQSIYGWGCYDLNLLLSEGLVSRLDIAELQYLEKSLDENRISNLTKGDFEDGKILQDEFKESRQAALEKIKLQIESITENHLKTTNL